MPQYTEEDVQCAERGATVPKERLQQCDTIRFRLHLKRRNRDVRLIESATPLRLQEVADELYVTGWFCTDYKSRPQIIPAQMLPRKVLARKQFELQKSIADVARVRMNETNECETKCKMLCGYAKVRGSWTVDHGQLSAKLDEHLACNRMHHSHSRCNGSQYHKLEDQSVGSVIVSQS
jgi:hypothetical protein